MLEHVLPPHSLPVAVSSSACMCCVLCFGVGIPSVGVMSSALHFRFQGVEGPCCPESSLSVLFGNPILPD